MSDPVKELVRCPSFILRTSACMNPYRRNPGEQTLKQSHDDLVKALEDIITEARSNVKCRPIVHDIAQKALEKAKELK